jgi:hypothetical protein
VGGACVANGEKRNQYRILVEKPDGNILLGRSRRMWVYSIKMGLVEIGLGELDLIDLVQDRQRRRALVNLVMKLRVP